MNRPLLVALVTFAVLLGGAAVPGLAQFGTSPYYGRYYSPYSQPPGLNPGGGPRLNPYLNFFRGTSPAVNYYLGVVPEIETRRFQRQTIGSIADLAGRTAPPAVSPEETEVNPALSITGHPAVFMNTTSYFGGAGPVPLSWRAVPITPLPPAKGGGAPAKPK
jgi:hypothetical protein